MEQENWTRFSRFVADKALLAMREQNVTQTILAEKMGRTQQYVSHILNGRENLTLETISLLDRSLGLGLLRDLSSGGGDRPAHRNFLSDHTDTYGRAWKESDLKMPESTGRIIHRFDTGDRPFVTRFSDGRKYLCKAARFGNGAYGLVRDFIGTRFASICGLIDSSPIPVRLFPRHTDGLETSEDYSVPCLGREWKEDTVEIIDSNHPYIKNANNGKTAETLMAVALFDIWLSNEDRLNNNLNLLYSFRSGSIAAIDHAGIFNTSFNAPLLLLSREDSVLYSNLFRDATEGKMPEENSIELLLSDFQKMTDACLTDVPAIRASIPASWDIDLSKYDTLMEFIFSPRWKKNATENFTKILKEVMK